MVYVFLADGFEEIEALAPIDILRRSGVEVLTVGVGGERITSSHKVGFVTDITDSEITLDGELEMIVLPGGMPGTINLEDNENVQRAIDFCVENERYIGAICAAPSILGRKDLLDGKEAICFPGFESELYGAKLSDKSVVRDGKIITAKGAGVAVKFGLALAALLTSQEQAEKLAASMQCE